MSLKSIITSALVALAIALPSSTGFSYAKNGGQGGGESHEGSGGNHGGNSSGREKSNSGHSRSMTKNGDQFRNGKSKVDPKKIGKAARAEAAERTGLNSLKRNYQAYLNSRDPRFADVFAFVRGYAQYELRNGVDTVPPGSAFSDEALREALATAAGTSTVSDASLDWAKHVLGVGEDFGKIDQVLDALAGSAQEY